MNITITKEALLTKLNEQLKLAKQEDARLLKEHRVEEQAALKKFRDRLREVLKYPYEKAKRVGSYRGESVDFKGPACPVSQATPIAQVIDQLKLDTRKQPFNVHPDSDIGQCLKWKPASERLKKGLCDDD